VSQQQAYLRKPLPPSSLSSSSNIDKNLLPLWVREHLTDYAVTLLSNEWELSLRNYSIEYLSPAQVLVKYIPPSSLDADDDSQNEQKVRVINFLSSSQQIVCSCPFSWMNALPCRHLLLIIRMFDIPFNHLHIHIRWHKSFALGNFMSIFHRSFLDGFIGVPCAKEFSPLSEFLPPNSSSTSTPIACDLNDDGPIPGDLANSLSSSSTAPNTSSTSTPFASISQAIGNFKKDILAVCNHSQEVTAFCLSFIQQTQQQFLQEYNEKFLITSSQGGLYDPTVISDLPPTRKRCLSQSEKYRKKRKRKTTTSTSTSDELVIFDTYKSLNRRPPSKRKKTSKVSSSSSIHLIENPSTPPLDAGTPPLIIDEMSGDEMSD
jgi:hypothetical protein